jgi:hypothetical protein
VEAARQERVPPGLARFGRFSYSGRSHPKAFGRGGWLLLELQAGEALWGCSVRRAGKPPEQPPEGGFDEKVQRQRQIIGHPFRVRDNAPGEERVGDGLRRAGDVSFMLHGVEPIGLCCGLQDLFLKSGKFFRGGLDRLARRKVRPGWRSPKNKRIGRRQGLPRGMERLRSRVGLHQNSMTATARHHASPSPSHKGRGIPQTGTTTLLPPLVGRAIAFG